MPRLRKTDFQRREEKLLKLIGGWMASEKLHNEEAGARIGLNRCQFQRRMQDPMDKFGFEPAARLAKAANMTGKQVLEVMGIPFEPPAAEA